MIEWQIIAEAQRRAAEQAAGALEEEELVESPGRRRKSPRRSCSTPGSVASAGQDSAAPCMGVDVQ